MYQVKNIVMIAWVMFFLSSVVVANPIHKPLVACAKSALNGYVSLDTKHFAKDVLVAYGILMGTIVVHELAHVAAIKVLYGVSSDTYIGMSTTDFPRVNSVPGKSTLSFVGFNWMGEYFPHWNENIKRVPIKDFVVYCAGPLLGALANFCSLKMLHAHSKHGYLLSKFMSIAGVLGHLGQFYPYQIPVFKTPSDGALAYRSLVDSITSKVS